MYENPYLRQYYQPQANTGIQWVQGETGAKSYMVAPNNSVLLMDSENSKFYIKSADAAGMPTLRIFEYKETPAKAEITPANIDINNYCTRAELETLREQIETIAKQLEVKKEGKEHEQ